MSTVSLFANKLYAVTISASVALPPTPPLNVDKIVVAGVANVTPAAG